VRRDSGRVNSPRHVDGQRASPRQDARPTVAAELHSRIHPEPCAPTGLFDVASSWLIAKAHGIGQMARWLPAIRPLAISNDGVRLAYDMRTVHADQIAAMRDGESRNSTPPSDLFRRVRLATYSHNAEVGTNRKDGVAADRVFPCSPTTAPIAPPEFMPSLDSRRDPGQPRRPPRSERDSSSHPRVIGMMRECEVRECGVVVLGAGVQTPSATCECDPIRRPHGAVFFFFFFFGDDV